jgi:hypothetical protein
MNILRLDLSSLLLQRKNIGTCMRSHYSACIRPPPNPSRRGKNGSEMRKRNKTDQTNGEGRNQPAYPRAIRKRSSKTTVKYWPVSPRLRLTNTKQIRYSASPVNIAAIIH